MFSKKDQGKKIKINKKEEKISKELEELEKKAQENLEGWQRAKADFINFKKRAEESRDELIKYSNDI